MSIQLPDRGREVELFAAAVFLGATVFVGVLVFKPALVQVPMQRALVPLPAKWSTWADERLGFFIEGLAPLRKASVLARRGRAFGWRVVARRRLVPAAGSRRRARPGARAWSSRPSALPWSASISASWFPQAPATSERRSSSAPGRWAWSARTRIRRAGPGGRVARRPVRAGHGHGPVLLRPRAAVAAERAAHAGQRTGTRGVKYGGLLRFVIGFGISAVMVVLLVRSVDAAALGEALVGRRLAPDSRRHRPVLRRRVAAQRALGPAAARSTTSRPGRCSRRSIVGFTVNNLLPIRMGEVARTYLLGRWRSVPYGATRGQSGRRARARRSVARGAVDCLRWPSCLRRLATCSSSGCCLAPCSAPARRVLAVASWRADAIPRLTAVLVRPLPARLGELGIRLATSFARALSLVRGRKRLASVAGLSLLAWSCRAEPVLRADARLRTLRPVCRWRFWLAQPRTSRRWCRRRPATSGTFDGALIGVLRDTAGIASAPATAYAIVVHATLFVPVVVLGTLLLWRSHMTFDQITHRARPPQRRAETAPPWAA